MKIIFVCRYGIVHIFAILAFLKPLLVFAVAEKDVYYDLTKEINRKLYKNDTEWDFSGFLLNFTGQHSPNVFYSTDKLLHEMDKLNNIARLLDENGQEQSKLYLSFQILNNSRLSGSRYSDAFYDILEREPVWHVESLKEHLSGVLLEVKFNQYQRCDSFENPLKVSFAKYAKAIRNDLIGDKKGSFQSSAKAGLVFNKKVCAWTRAQQFGADFIVSEVDFEIISDFPWSFNQFKKYLLNCKREGGYDFSKKFTEKNETFVFKINLSNSNQPSFSPVSDNILNEVIQEREQFYLQKLQQYAEIWTKEEKVSDLILQNNLEWSGRDRKAFVERDWLLPEVKVQKVDVNPCQLKTMLGTVAKHFSSVVFNEFTWAALEWHSDRMGGKNCPNSESLSVSPQLYLFFTPGIGKVWDYSGKYFEKVLKEKKSGWTVQTLIFSSTDLGNNDQTVANFAKKMHNSHGFSIGCAVNMQDDNLQRIYSGREIKSYLNSTVFKRCENIWDVTSVIILQFAPQYEPLLTKYDDKWYSMLLWRMVTAQFLKKLYANMEVILHLTNEINFSPRFKLIKGWGPNGRVTCDPDTLKWIEVQRKIQSWAAIHQIKVVFGNAFYNFEEEDDGGFENVVFGLWNYPYDSGELNKENVFDCHDSI